MVISSHNPPSEAVVHWLAGRPGGPTACAGPPIRQRSGPGCHLGCSGRSSWRLPGKRPRRFPPWAQRGKCESRYVREPQVLQPPTNLRFCTGFKKQQTCGTQHTSSDPRNLTTPSQKAFPALSRSPFSSANCLASSYVTSLWASRSALFPISMITCGRRDRSNDPVQSLTNLNLPTATASCSGSISQGANSWTRIWKSELTGRGSER